MKPTSAARIIALSFLVSMAAGAAFVTGYLRDWGPQALGGIMALAVAALALGLLLWSTKLLPSETVVETRAPLEPPFPAQTAFVDTAERGGAGSPKLVRRTLVLSLLGLCAAAVVPLRSLIPSSSVVPARGFSRTSWRSRGKRLMTHDGELIKATDVVVGTMITAVPEGEPEAYYETVVLLRLSPQDVSLLPAIVQQGTVEGLIAFSKLCTHAGCPVGLYEDVTRQLFCPCHQSVFDVLQGARAIAGPASRPLPQLPLDIDGEGYIVGTGDFSGQPGPTYWKDYWRPYQLGEGR